LHTGKLHQGVCEQKKLNTIAVEDKGMAGYLPDLRVTFNMEPVEASRHSRFSPDHAESIVN
jgi:hypothetical protein